ncbi:transmembrane protein 267-like [Patiria miniata]|uniref:Transmembrane protein 267 n=1 Tax=Patiria miniata TaxID=46514 RepID=A0A914A2Q7_PATMI|nr:transmembrane protein 267-like [Patiria miniata]
MCGAIWHEMFYIISNSIVSCTLLRRKSLRNILVGPWDLWVGFLFHVHDDLSLGLQEMATFTSNLLSATRTIVTFRTALGIIILGSACVSLDHILQLQAVVSNLYCRAFMDSFTHGLVGVLSWAIVIGAIPPTSCRQLGEILFCGMLSSGLDVDHFVAARSIYLQDALVLPHRPVLHSTSLILLIGFILLLTTRITASHKLRPLPYMFLTASLSHHIRDGSRRGLWLWPLGSTPPLPYWTYIGLVCILPVVVELFLDRTESTLPLKASNGAVSALSSM